MNRFFDVKSDALFGRKVVLEDRVFETASLCPFFDRIGHTAWIMLLSDEPDIRFFRPLKTAVKVPLWGPVQVESSWSRLNELQPHQLDRLWHFDPKMLLKEPHLAFHPLAKTILATNCVNRFGWKAKSMCYHRQLLGVRRVLKKSSEGDAYVKYKGDLLPEPPRFAKPQGHARTSYSRRTAWKLSPFWQA